MRLGARLMGAITGAIGGWRMAGLRPEELNETQRRYVDAWEWYSGQRFADLTDKRYRALRNDPRIYNETRLLWKHHEAVGDFYAGVVYSGALSTDGAELSDGTKGAIPIEPQTGSDERNGLLLEALSSLWAGWNWQQYMSLRPLYGAVLGDVLTEIVDDTDRRFVYPSHIWPGYVTEIELDHVGNVRQYTLEYPVDEKQDNGHIERYLFRKEVTPEEFRYYRDDVPYDAFGEGSVVVNPYGFVPAIWDRHRIGAPGSVRGRSATDGTRQALTEFNSILAQAMDYQAKAFHLPPMIATDRPASGNVSVETQADRESEDYIPVPGDSTLLQTQIDIGKTLEILKDLREGILSENPEASFYQQMREMQQVTAPGAERLMGDVKNRVDMARAGYDAQSVKLFQMSIAIAGMRVTSGDWTRDGARLNRRQQVFANFDLESYSRGELDMAILPRPIVMPTEAERVEMATMIETLTTSVGMRRAGVKDEDAAAILSEREAVYAARLNSGAFGQDYGEVD